MTAQPTGCDTRPELREEIHEAVGMASLHAGIVQDFASIGDDVGMAYALRKMVVYVRHASSIFQDLDALNRRRRAEAGDAAA